MRVAAILVVALAALPACARVHAAWRVLTQPEPVASVPSPSAPAPSPAPPASTTPPSGASAPAAGEPAPAAPAASSPSPPLTPDVPTDQARRLRDAAQHRLDETDRLIRRLEGRPLAPKDRETLALAESFLDQARQALANQEYERAANLAAKARTLTDGLTSGKQ